MDAASPRDDAALDAAKGEAARLQQQVDQLAAETVRRGVRDSAARVCGTSTVASRLRRTTRPQGGMYESS